MPDFADFVTRLSKQVRHWTVSLWGLSLLLLVGSTGCEPVVFHPPISPLPTETPAPQVTVREAVLTLDTYPYRDYLFSQFNPTYNMDVLHFDRASFEAAAPTPSPVDYQAVMLENPYLRLTFLPELGGRLYSAVIKATDQEIFYHNPVVKPSRYGLLQPPEANWWLAVGGMEWAYPTQEHGYRWGIPWQYEVTQSAEAATITLRDEAAGRVGVAVQVTLPANSAAFTVKPQLTNAGSEAVPIQFWTNAVLSLRPGSMEPHTRFILPLDQVKVHSRGADGWSIPEARATMPWPTVGNTHLDNYAEWANYLGFFAPDMAVPFMAAYNPIDDLGLARLITPGTVPGNKLFAFSLTFPYRDYTDDDSQYFEMWGGINQGFWPEDDIWVEPGESIGWTEQWWPLAGLGGLTWANNRVALTISPGDAQQRLSLLVTQPTHGQIQVQSDDTDLLLETFTATPDTPMQWQIPSSSGPITITITDVFGEQLLTYLVD